MVGLLIIVEGVILMDYRGCRRHLIVNGSGLCLNWFLDLVIYAAIYGAI